MKKHHFRMFTSKFRATEEKMAQVGKQSTATTILTASIFLLPLLTPQPTTNLAFSITSVHCI